MIMGFGLVGDPVITDRRWRGCAMPVFLSRSRVLDHRTNWHRLSCSRYPYRDSLGAIIEIKIITAYYLLMIAALPAVITDM